MFSLFSYKLVLITFRNPKACWFVSLSNLVVSIVNFWDFYQSDFSNVLSGIAGSLTFTLASVVLFFIMKQADIADYHILEYLIDEQENEAEGVILDFLHQQAELVGVGEKFKGYIDSLEHPPTIKDCIRKIRELAGKLPDKISIGF